MNKYELAVVVSAKIEDEDRAATIEKVKEYITRFGGTVTERRRVGQEESSLTKSRKCVKDFTTSFASSLMQHARQRLRNVSVSWRMSSDIYALDRMHK